MDNTRRVRVTVEEGQFEGDVLDSNFQMLRISNVENCVTGKKLNNVLTFFSNEVIRVDPVNETKEESTNDKSEVVSECIKTNAIRPQDSDKTLEKRVKSVDGNRGLDVHIIDKLNNEFYKAIRNIQEHKIIGLAVEGILVGRRGKLCWLQIRASDEVYLFDILQSANLFFKNGLKEIIEEPNLLKIMHDCRLPSDALYHKHNIKIVNVFDTQVADGLIRKMDKRRLPPRVRNLADCIEDYLNITAGVIRLPTRTFGMMDEEEEKIWMERPIQKKTIALAVQNVAYLQELRMEMMQLMLLELELGVDIYLGQIRDARDEDISIIRLEFFPDGFDTLPDNARKVRATSFMSKKNDVLSQESTIPSYFRIKEPDSFKVSQEEREKEAQLKKNSSDSQYSSSEESYHNNCHARTVKILPKTNSPADNSKTNSPSDDSKTNSSTDNSKSVKKKYRPADVRLPNIPKSFRKKSMD